ncbi:MAG: hypothetical protein J1E99_06780 [Muribaculaceae bacterium]|nr:hypothetical protein [Muribaculaceae bacterium]
MKQRWIIVFLTLIVSGVCSKSVSQEFLWDVDFRTIFDNREGNYQYSSDKTFFLTQLSPEIGLSLHDGEHSVLGGMSWTQPIGSEWDGYKISPTVYYRFHRGGLSGFLGMFPRRNLYRKVPDYIWNDSTYYVQHNIRGAGIVNVGCHGFFQAILDWRGMQSDTRREAFNVIAMGEWYKSPQSPVFLGGTAMMNHLAKTSAPDESEGVVDNFLINPYAGINFTNLNVATDSLSLRVGLLGSATRDRASEKKWKVPFGFWMDMAFKWRWIGFREEIYAGKALFPFYSTYGALLDQGEPYYASDFYSRTELIGYILDNSFVKLKASLDFNYAGKDLLFYQRLILNIYFDGSLGRR